MPRDGTIRPYRPKPRDFRESYLRLGWDGIVAHYRTNWRVIARWIDEEGRDQLRADRRAAVQRRLELVRSEERRRWLARQTAVTNASAAV